MASTSPFPLPSGLGDFPSPPTCDHAVLFFDEEPALCEAVADFLADGLRVGQPALLFTLPSRHEAIEHELAARHLDPRRLQRAGRFTFVDGTRALAAFMDGELPDPRRFEDTVVPMLAGQRGRAPARVFGDMVEVLWRDGRRAGATRLEALWNDLAERHAFSLLCGYGLEAFPLEEHGEGFQEICRLHERVIPAESFPRWNDRETQAREVSRLQQRARALEAEVARRRALEGSLRDALDDAERASRAKSDFLAVMSHELRTPLNAILGYRELLAEGLAGPVTPQQGEYLGRIAVGARQLLRLIDQVLSLSRIEEGVVELAVEDVDAVDVAREAAELVEPGLRDKGLTFHLDVPPEGLPCTTDPGKLGQVLLNMLANAVKFTDRGTVTLSAEAAGESLVFRVRDTGEGISSGDLERIFEPFVQVDPSATRVHGGSGLGLAVSRNLARVLGGELTVESRPGEGSTFALRIPVALEPTREA